MTTRHLLRCLALSAVLTGLALSPAAAQEKANKSFSASADLVLNATKIALVEEGDTISIDIPGRSINLEVESNELTNRRTALEASRADQAYRPIAPRRRRVSQALRAYAVFASSADQGGVRDLSKVEGA